MKDLNILKDEILKVNKEKGWHEKKVSFSGRCALINSEISEAFEEYRKGKAITETYYIKGKPEGIPIELADVIIRILDYFGVYNIDVNNLDGVLSPEEYFSVNDFEYVISSFHLYVSRAFEHSIIEDEYLTQSDCINAYLKGLIMEIMAYCIFMNIDIYEAIDIKIEYNKTRSYRHGNKII